MPDDIEKINEIFRIHDENAKKKTGQTGKTGAQPAAKPQEQPQPLLLLQPHPQLLPHPQPPQPKRMMRIMIIHRTLLLLQPLQNIYIFLSPCRNFACAAGTVRGTADRS